MAAEPAYYGLRYRVTAARERAILKSIFKLYESAAAHKPENNKAFLAVRTPAG